MEELVYIIIVFSIAIVLGILLFFVKKIDKYKQEQYKELVLRSERYFQELQLSENCYLEIVKYHGANIEFGFKNKNTYDYISKLSLKKNY